MSKFTCAEILEQLKKICAYYFFDSSFQTKMMMILNRIANQDNADDYAKKYEDETDDFIHQIASHVDGDRDKSIKLINNAPEEILVTLIVRLITFDEYCNNNPEKAYMLLFDNNKQLVIDCLINFWRFYNHEDPLNSAV